MTEKRGPGRPATGVTPQRTIRVPDDTWEAARDLAAERGEDLSKVLRRALDEYIASSHGPASGAWGPAAM